VLIRIEELDPEIEGVELFQCKAAQKVLAPKWRVIFEGWIWVLLTYLFDPNLKVISQYDINYKKKKVSGSDSCCATINSALINFSRGSHKFLLPSHNLKALFEITEFH
jgi:hypothetical protein